MHSCNILLIRHGITKYNRERRFQGQLDVPLSDEGRRQAQKLAQQFKPGQIQAIYSSDLSRAKETAEIIARAIMLKIESYRPDLREICFGHWQGHTMDEVAELYPEELAIWRADRTYSAPHGGETYAQLADRGFKAVQEIAASHPGQTVAVVAHGALIRAVLCKARGIDLSDRSQPVVDNASVTAIEI
ncbi:MAG: histidine phosphatase family protein [bacterium]